MVSPVIAQAILGMKAPDILGSFEEGRKRAREEQERLRLDKVRDLSGRALQEGGGESLRELQGLDPLVAQKLQSDIGARSATDLSEFVQSAGVLRRMLQSGDAPGALQYANQRLHLLQMQGRNTEQTQRMRDKIASGDIQGAIGELSAFDEALSKAKDINLQSFAPQQFTRPDGTVGFGVPTVNPRTGETAFKEVPLPPGAQFTSKRETVGEVGAKAAAREAGKLASQFKLKPEVEAAVRSAVDQAATMVKREEGSRSDDRALQVYEAAMGGLATALGKTTTGPGIGLIPALTAEQQTADGAVAAMAPVLKQLFRAAGEGTFTDKDQELLLAMVPTRTDHPQTRAAKIKNIDAIVRAKLGQSAPTGAAPRAAPAQQAAPGAAPAGAPTGQRKVQVDF